MALIYITDTLKKEVKDKLLINQLVKEVQKHSKGNNNLIDLYSPEKDLKVYKAYLDSGRVRAAILLKLSAQIYVPLVIVKKESRLGWNLSKYSESYLGKRILKIWKDVQNKKYEILNLTDS
ncbi:MAG: hypothetical protein WCX95_00950 [Candidatus Gracilibacteria bacterium]